MKSFTFCRKNAWLMQNHRLGMKIDYLFSIDIYIANIGMLKMNFGCYLSDLWIQFLSIKTRDLPFIWKLQHSQFPMICCCFLSPKWENFWMLDLLYSITAFRFPKNTQKYITTYLDDLPKSATTFGIYCWKKHLSGIHSPWLSCYTDE